MTSAASAPLPRTALVVGAGPGIGASVARALLADGFKVGLAARNGKKLAALAAEIGAEAFPADAADAASIAQLFDEVDVRLGAPDLVVYNASGRLRGSLLDLDPAGVQEAVAVSAFGAFLVTQHVSTIIHLRGKMTSRTLTSERAGR